MHSRMKLWYDFGMEDKITIIEGPPPTFQAVNERWVLGLNESPNLSGLVVTHLRTFNGPALVERCHRAWRNNVPIHLEFRTPDGLDKQAPIVAARAVDTDDGHLLILWLSIADEGVELEIGYDDEADDEDDFGFLDFHF